MKRILILAVAWLALSAVAAAAQTTAAANLSFNIPTMLKIVNNSTASPWTMPVPTDAEIESGATISSTNVIDIETKGNVNYAVTVTAPNFTFTPPPAYPTDTYTKNANTASVTVGGTTAVLNSGTLLIQHPRGATNHDNATANVTVSLADHPGDYATVVTFTIAAN